MIRARSAGPAGKLLEEAGAALRATDRAAFENATARLGRLIVAGGMDASSAPLAARVETATAGLRRTLTFAALSPADPRAKSAVEAVALACANLDARIERYGMPPDPLASAPEPEPGKGRKGRP